MTKIYVKKNSILKWRSKCILPADGEDTVIPQSEMANSRIGENLEQNWPPYLYLYSWSSLPDEYWKKIKTLKVQSSLSLKIGFSLLKDNLALLTELKM